jgi:hypothetical protein
MTPPPTTAAPGPTPNPAPDPSPSPTPSPSSTGEFVWSVESSGRAEPLSAIWGSGPGDVWAAGGHGVVRSAGDGTWTTMHEDASDEYAAGLASDGFLFVGGSACSNGLCQGGVLLRSSDGGASFTRQTLAGAVTGFTAAGATLYADSDEVYASTDHFASSTTVPLGWATSNGIYADGAALFAYGGLRGAEIRRTSDGGQSWATVYSGYSGSKSGTINGVARGGAALYAVANGCSVPACVGALFRSGDDGATWQEASRPQDWLAGVWAASADEIYVGGTTLMRSVDGGAHFSAVALPADTSILALYAPSNGELYAVGQEGTILHGRR